MLYDAHRLVEQLTLDRDLMHLRDRLAPEVAEMVYYGFWYHAKLDALMAFIREAQRPVTGEVTLNLYKGNMMVAGRRAPTASTTRASPRWKAAARTTRPTPRASCGSRACPAASRPGSGRGSIEPVGLRKCVSPLPLRDVRGVRGIGSDGASHPHPTTRALTLTLSQRERGLTPVLA